MEKEFEALKNISIRCHSKVVWDDPIDSDLDTVKQALLKAQELEKENEGLKADLTIELNNKKNAVEMLKEQVTLREKQEKVLEVIKEKCLYTDNLSYVIACSNYDRYKEEMSKLHDTLIVKIDWNDKVVLDYLGLFTQEEFETLKRWASGWKLQ